MRLAFVILFFIGINQVAKGQKCWGFFAAVDDDKKVVCLSTSMELDCFRWNRIKNWRYNAAYPPELGAWKNAIQEYSQDAYQPGMLLWVVYHDYYLRGFGTKQQADAEKAGLHDDYKSKEMKVIRVPFLLN